MDKRIAVWNALQGPVREFADLKGRCLSRAEQDGEELQLYLSENNYVRFYHDQDCCESVEIEDVCGDLRDLVGEPLTEAEEVQGYHGPDLDLLSLCHPARRSHGALVGYQQRLLQRESECVGGESGLDRTP